MYAFSSRSLLSSGPGTPLRAALRLAVALSLTVALASCDSFLDYEPKGTISGEQLGTPERVDGLVTAAYSALGNDHWTTPYTNDWPYGNVRADDAYKGGGGLADQGDYNAIEQFVFIQPDLGLPDQMWFRLYLGISRANQALRRMETLTEEAYPQKAERQAEMRFIRGHFYFVLKTLFKRVPYITEEISEDEISNVSNVERSDQELWSAIEADFRFAVENLPTSQPEVGRIDLSAAQAYLAKTLLYSAYEQDEQHQVVGINQEKLQEVVALADQVEGALQPSIAENFLWEFENNDEAIFAVQRSINDGTPQGRVAIVNGLNYPMSGGYGCCWFHIPSQNLVNAFQTTEAGLPRFDAFNEVVIDEPQEFQENTFDPRLDHTVAIPTHPFKYEVGKPYDLSWARTPQLYGPFASMKELQRADCPCLRAVGPFYASSKNTIIIRYADVLLWKAEALIELGQPDAALPIINQIRERAAASVERLSYEDGRTFSSYNIAPYRPGENITWTQETARRALRWERRMEFAMEGYRFFDLVRWGIAAETLNAYFDAEEERRPYLQEARFTEGRDEYLPIPQQQIDFSRGLYEQNTGWPGG